MRWQEEAKSWQHGWQSGYNSLNDLGGKVLNPTVECFHKFNDIVQQEWAKVKTEQATIEDAKTKLAQANTKLSELGDLGRKAKEAPNGMFACI